MTCSVKGVYKADSVNLFIGNNGSGKTETITSIIDDILHEQLFFTYQFDKSEHDKTNQGIIYYTATPYRRELPKRVYLRENFENASPSETNQDNCTIDIERYIENSRILGNTNKIKSKTSHSIKKISTLITKTLLSNRSILKKELLNQFGIDYVLNDFLEKHNINEENAQTFDSLLIEINKNSTINYNNHIKRERRNYSDIELLYINVTEKITSKLSSHTKKHNKYQMLLAIHIACEEQDRSDEKNFNLFEAIKEFLETENTSTFSSKFEKLEKIRWDISYLLPVDGQIYIEKSNIIVSLDIDDELFKIPEEILKLAHKWRLISLRTDKMSSGQAAIYNQITLITEAIAKLKKKGFDRILIFIDEGDMLLHTEWQRKYIDLIDHQLGRLKRILKIKCIQLIIATHSPLLASDVFKENITTFDKEGNIFSFGAPLQQIVNYNFKTKTIGAIAERVIKKLLIKKEKDELFSEEDKNLINKIDNGIVKKLLA